MGYLAKAVATCMLVALLGGLISVNAARECVSYTPTQCMFSGVLPNNKLCKPQHCFFHAHQEFACPFAESGGFKYSALQGDSCPDPFMETGSPLPRRCGDRCCKGDLPGDFKVTGTIRGACAAKYQFQPNVTGCSYDEVTRGQILGYLEAESSGVLVVGDSMLRQFYLRFIMMLRGQSRLLDHHLQSHAQYRICPEGDMYRVSGNTANESSIDFDNEFLQAQIPTFFSMKTGPGASSVRKALDRCSSQPVPIDYMFSPEFGRQITAIPAFFKVTPPEYKPIVIVSVMYWVHSARIPDSYLDTLKFLGSRAKRVYLVTIPRIKVPKQEWQEMYHTRNEFFKNWVKENDGPFEILDFDMVAAARNAPPGGAKNNWHYMCSITWNHDACPPGSTQCEPTHMDSRNGLTINGYRAAQAKGRIAFITATEDGQCVDEMNRNLWQMVWNTELGLAAS